MMEDSIFRELQEDIQRDRLHQLWKEYGRFIIALCIAVVLGTTAGVLWKHYRTSKNQQDTSVLLTALNAKGPGAQGKALAEVEKAVGPGGAGALAALKVASMEREDGDNEAALAIYKRLAEGDAKDEALAELSRVLSVYTALDAGKQSPVLAAAKDGAPFVLSEREAAAWQALAANDSATAAQHFSALKDEVNSPPAFRQRMQAVASYVAASEKPAVGEISEPATESPGE